MQAKLTVILLGLAALARRLRARVPAGNALARPIFLDLDDCDDRVGHCHVGWPG